MTSNLTPLAWLPSKQDWNSALDAARALGADQRSGPLLELSNYCIDFIQTARLDRAVQAVAEHARASLSATPSVRLAILGSSTLAHLLPGIRIGALRRGVWVDAYEGAYGMYRQELQDPTSALHQFNPDVLLLSLDATHLLGSSGASVEEALNGIRQCWQLAKQSLRCTIIQQTVLPVFHPLLGNNEHRLPQSRLAMTWKLNQELRNMADAEGVHLLAVDALSAQDGIPEWHDEALWHRSKQEIHPRVSHTYGDQVGRILAALRGRSYKCLVLDLDNTVWGGVIGDDGLAGIALGQGNAVGEAHVAFQKFALELSTRGIILAVCSKNDEANALEAFDRHPEMILRRKDIACFVANWNDKATNLRFIAKTLNIGIDSLVFADDNPFERNLIRQELPQVAVPELPEDPALYTACIANAGYFETLTITAEDQARNSQYQANAERELLRESATDMTSYLSGLRMELHCTPFDSINLPRIVQLINKTNQFNLTTRRYTEPEVAALMSDPANLLLQLRLIDKFGDNGIIALIIGKLNNNRELVLDTWLMSCRVLGRQVEAATLNIIARNAVDMGARKLVGLYKPTAKNGMVREHYQKLGFEAVSQEPDGSSLWQLELNTFTETEILMQVIERHNDHRADLQSTY